MPAPQPQKPGALPVKNATQFPGQAQATTPSQAMGATVARRNVMNKVERAFKPHWR